MPTLVAALRLDGVGWGAALGWSAVCIAVGIVPPTLLLIVQRRRHGDRDWYVTVREQRFGLYALGLVCLAALIALARFGGAPRLLLPCLVAALAATAIGAALNRVTKVSVHVGAATGCALLLAFLAPQAAPLLAAAVALVAWSRLRLSHHTRAAGGARSRRRGAVHERRRCRLRRLIQRRRDPIQPRRQKHQTIAAAIATITATKTAERPRARGARDVVEVHAVDARQERERDEDARHQRQHLHHLVGALADVREVQVHQRDAHLAGRVDGFHDLRDVVVGVAQEDAHGVADEGRVVAQQRRERLALRCADAADHHEPALDLVDLRERVVLRAARSPRPRAPPSPPRASARSGSSDRSACRSAHTRDSRRPTLRIGPMPARDALPHRLEEAEGARLESDRGSCVRARSRPGGRRSRRRRQISGTRATITCCSS